MPSKKGKNPVEEIQETVAESNESPFQKNEFGKKKMTPYLLMVLTYCLVTGDQALTEEIEQVRESQPFMKITDDQKEALISMRLLEEENGKLHVTKAGEALILKGCTFGVNFQRLISGLTFNDLMGLFINCGNALVDQIRQPITLVNKQGVESEVSKGLRSLMHRLYDKIEWPEDTQQQ